ncbi:MAG: hypothetical protein DRI57_20550 [Deltaproteobacteria bacterium]|nr:MAG: hypothetical protein DRI57_20550 [Deltaproteobacteria bacterium]
MKNKKIRIRFAAIPIFLAVMIWGHAPNQAFSVAEIEIPSSFNPVGSGARAMGMGGAFIAVADDATAASWNPGGLTQLILPEFSVVTAGTRRTEDIDFGLNPEGAGSHNIFDANINYLSVVYPFGLFNRNMVLALTYQRLYDLTREWNFIFQNSVMGTEDYWNIRQNGSLSALGLSYCAQIIPDLSVGVTLNIWDDDLSPNGWEQKFTSDSKIGGMSLMSFFRSERYSFKGMNANIGLLWDINYRLRVGAVLKTPFKANVLRELRETHIYPSEFGETMFSEHDIRNEEIEMPMSYGIGVAYRFSDNFFMSADVYRTEWGDFIYREEDGNKKSPVSARPFEESDVNPACQVRWGTEYRFVNREKGYVVPVRAGLFYDPAPAEGSSDDFYGFSFGMGFVSKDRFSLDIAYQYRLGNDVGEYILESLRSSQDVDEHMVYLSLIFYH